MTSLHAPPRGVQTDSYRNRHSVSSGIFLSARIEHPSLGAALGTIFREGVGPERATIAWWQPATERPRRGALVALARHRAPAHADGRGTGHRRRLRAALDALRHLRWSERLRLPSDSPRDGRSDGLLRSRRKAQAGTAPRRTLKPLGARCKVHGLTRAALALNGVRARTASNDAGAWSPSGTPHGPN